MYPYKMKQFYDFVLTFNPTDLIMHRSSTTTSASWNDCAVGLFAKHTGESVHAIKSQLLVEEYEIQTGEELSDAGDAYFDINGWRMKINPVMERLNHVDAAPTTYGELAKLIVEFYPKVK